MCTAVSSVLSNQFATGGLTVGAAGVALAAVRSLGRYLGEVIVRRCVVTAEIDSRDDSYRWVLTWLMSHPELATNTHFTVSTTLRRYGHTAPEDEESSGGSDGILLLPAGRRSLTYCGKLLLVSREKEQESAFNSGKERESLTLRLVRGTQQDLRHLISEARAAYIEREQARTAIYFTDEYGGWNRVASKPRRPLGSVVLGREGQGSELLADCSRFLGAEPWYAARGIPYRRGYLLHGPPGTGKTSLVAALAGELQLPIYVVSLSSARLTDDSFAEALAGAARRCVLLLEDADAAFAGRQAVAGAAGGGLTFSGLLNGIDGVAAQEGRLLFLTTNHVDRLDEALLRPGRVDVRVPFERCGGEQLRRYLRHFYGEGSDAAAEELCSCVPPGSLSVAQLQGALMLAPHDPRAGVEAVREMLANQAGTSSGMTSEKGRREDAS